MTIPVTRKEGASKLSQTVFTSTPEAPWFILGDFNHCKLEIALPGFNQYVQDNTRGKKLLDKCFVNVKKAYTAKIKPPLGTSDHNEV